MARRKRVSRTNGLCLLVVLGEEWGEVGGDGDRRAVTRDARAPSHVERPRHQICSPAAIAGMVEAHWAKNDRHRWNRDKHAECVAGEQPRKSGNIGWQEPKREAGAASAQRH